MDRSLEHVIHLVGISSELEELDQHGRFMVARLLITDDQLYLSLVEDLRQLKLLAGKSPAMKAGFEQLDARLAACRLVKSTMVERLSKPEMLRPLPPKASPSVASRH